MKSRGGKDSVEKTKEHRSKDMSKKVLIISSSPRKGGNSDILCDAFAEGAREADHEVEKVRIADLKIGYCTSVQ